MLLAVIVAVAAPCFVLSLLIVLTVCKPAAAPALAEVLRAIAEPIRALRHSTSECVNEPEETEGVNGTVAA